MPRLRALSGDDLLRIFSLFGFTVFSQRGSHVKLRRKLTDGSRQTLTVVMHKEVDKGTLRAIFRQALRYVPESELMPHFFTEKRSRRSIWSNSRPMSVLGFDPGGLGTCGEAILRFDRGAGPALAERTIIGRRSIPVNHPRASTVFVPGPPVIWT